MRLFYDEHIAPTATTHTLSEEESKHIVRVLRLEKGQEIGILDGKGRLFTCEINDAHPKRCMLNIVLLLGKLVLFLNFFSDIDLPTIPTGIPSGL